jgi:hypothetical protein
MKQLRLLFYQLIIILTIFIYNNSSAQTFQNPIARQQKGGMQVAEVIVSDTQTLVKAFCVNDNYKPSALISTSPPNTNNAFRLIANQKFYHIRKVEGIPLSPESLTLNYGDTVHFELVFDAIPKKTDIIDLVEGATTVENAWMVYGLQLMPTFIQNGHPCMFKNEQSFKGYYKKNNMRLWEIEGFWQLEANYADKKSNVEKPCYNFKKVAIVRENNIFCIYNMNGERLNISFKHYRRERYVFTVPIEDMYPLQRTFKLKNDAMKLNLKLARRHVKLLNLDNDFDNRVYYKTNWTKIY